MKPPEYKFPPIKDLYEMYVAQKLVKEITEEIKKNPKLGKVFKKLLMEQKPTTTDGIMICFYKAKEVVGL